MPVLYRAAASLLLASYVSTAIAKEQRAHFSQPKNVIETVAPQRDPADRQDTAHAINLIQQYMSDNSYGGSVKKPSCGSNRIEMDIEQKSSHTAAKKQGINKLHWAIERDLNKEDKGDPDVFINITGSKDGKKVRFIIEKHGADWAPPAGENYSPVIAAAENLVRELGLNFRQKIDFSSTMDCHTAEFKIKEHKIIENDLSSENTVPVPEMPVLARASNLKPDARP